MRKMICWTLLLAIVLPFVSCKKEMMGYEGMEGVYFGVRSGPSWAAPVSWPFRPYTNVEFVKQPQEVQEMVINIAVNITGPVKNYDRPFKVVVNPDSTTLNGRSPIPTVRTGVHGVCHHFLARTLWLFYKFNIRI